MGARVGNLGGAQGSATAAAAAPTNVVAITIGCAVLAICALLAALAYVQHTNAQL